jgi:hypothetical protein
MIKALSQVHPRHLLDRRLNPVADAAARLSEPAARTLRPSPAG